MFLASLSSFLLLLAVAVAHQSIGDPTPISYNRKCRVGDGEYCPGPCPRKSLRHDVTPSNPPITARRGGWIEVKVLKNNHVGGFVRWSIVKVRHMYSHDKHRKFAFYYSCADQKVRKCTYKNKRNLCPTDKMNQYYQHRLQIPKIYTDGTYVLGFAWYGGLTKKKEYGFFGDYYDCTYIKIRGGDIKGYYPVKFHMGNSLLGRDGKCKATVNKLGVCRTEPCLGGNGPLGYREGYYQVPAEFSNGRRPVGLKRADIK